jgi:hypothetical protein
MSIDKPIYKSLEDMALEYNVKPEFISDLSDINTLEPSPSVSFKEELLARLTNIESCLRVVRPKPFPEPFTENELTTLFEVLLDNSNVQVTKTFAKISPDKTIFIDIDLFNKILKILRRIK